MKFVAVDGKQVAFASWPGPADSRTTFVCLPGLGDKRQEFRYLAPELAKLGRTIVMDLRGLGDSDVGFQSYDPDDSGRDILALLEAEDLARVTLIGVSMTAASCVFAASSSPRVAAVAVLGPFCYDVPMPFGVHTLLRLLMSDWIGAWFWTTFYRSLYPKADAVPDLNAYIAELKRHVSSPGRVAAVRWQMLASKAKCAATIPAFAAKGLPTLAIFGTKDPDFPKPEAAAVELVRRLNEGRPVGAPQAAYQMVDGCGHYPHVEAPDTVLKAIKQLVAAL